MTAGADPLARLRDAAARRAAAGLRRTLRPRLRPDGLTDLASNDYLGLAGDPRLAEGAAAAARAWGTGSTGSRLVTGTTELHAELDRRLAAFTGSAAAWCSPPASWPTSAPSPPSPGPGTLVVSDQVNHASIVDACRLSRARVVIVPHRDTAAVEQALAEREEDDALVVTDAVFSVDGDLAPLAALHAAVRAHGALLVIDEAHALGVVGDGGRGAAHAAGLAGEPDVVLTLTLSKSLGSQGGAVLGAPEVIDTLVDTGRSFIFDTGLNPPGRRRRARRARRPRIRAGAAGPRARPRGPAGGTRGRFRPGDHRPGRGRGPGVPGRAAGRRPGRRDLR
ncbi:aminotransferase class I/II-fold pyridoxal phosphate-dependent enzyme [Actinomadura madurae]|uniref:aminotransferase class I/II-fold pyridoxal phosphate-dependent enzyme n=1 Tax=Actinomadura madurae TaxID=1993 RepID=UPI0020D21DDF|nr:aminotransferase class I/II-fold pyridoxal phosphate-dependent enzyme [Actinomadura madurae]MCQ0005093.1 aminotransferase class I/II-fold pyridoxal phosphate-dependent enzyme [Actinomadura madurae]